MFEFDTGKLLLVAVVALIFIGPKELPQVLRQLGHFVAQARRILGEFQGQFMEAIRDTELENIRNDLASVRDAAKIGNVLNPVTHIKSAITDAINTPLKKVEPPVLDPAMTPAPFIPPVTSEPPAQPAPATASEAKPRLRIRADAFSSKPEPATDEAKA